MGQIALSIQGLTKHFVSGGVRQTVLAGINLEVRAGEAIAITGRSGSGKSTLLNLLGQMDVPDSGNIVYAGASASNWNEEQRTTTDNSITASFEGALTRLLLSEGYQLLERDQDLIYRMLAESGDGFIQINPEKNWSTGPFSRLLFL